MKFKKRNVRVVQHVHSVLSALAVAFIIAGQAVAEDLQPQFADYETVKLAGKLRTPPIPFTLEVRCVPFKEAGQPKNPAPQYVGPDGEDPFCVVRRIALTLEGKTVKFPSESYTDLANLVLSFGVQLKSRPGLVTLQINGGDGAGSYKARFFIQGGRLMSREIEDMNEQGEVRLTKKVY